MAMNWKVYLICDLKLGNTWRFLQFPGKNNFFFPGNALPERIKLTLIWILRVWLPNLQNQCAKPG